MRHFSPDSPSRRGFTLVELLVVISIISLLISILLPALGMARETARSMACLSNLRQAHLGVHLYTQDYKGYYPTAGKGGDKSWDTGNWSGAVAHYLSVPYLTEWDVNGTTWPDLEYVGVTSPKRDDVPLHILKCPTENFKNYWGRKLAVSYGYNTASGGMGIADSYTMDPTHRDTFGRVLDAQIVRPSTTILAGEDYHHDPAQGKYEYRTQQFLAPDDLSTYHNGGGNVLWADSHATSTKASELTAADFDRRK